MKSVLISIQPKWCELIASGKKTVEVRKTRPKIDVPFKCYIYCTSSNKHECLMQNESGVKLIYACDYNAIPCGGYIANSKVIGEFVCDRIQAYECEFVDDDCYEEIASILVDEDGDATGFIEWSNDSDFSYESTGFYKKCCVKYEELKKYMGQGINEFYGWHIDNLVIYDQPKELSEFRTHCKYEFDDDFEHCEGCQHYYYSNTPSCGAEEYCGCDGLKPIIRPPQSWCYVEHPTEKGGAE